MPVALYSLILELGSYRRKIPLVSTECLVPARLWYKGSMDTNSVVLTLLLHHADYFHALGRDTEAQMCCWTRSKSRCW